MALRIPQNQIVESKYTIGKEYLLVDTYKEYQGYYYELNNKFFAGKEFDVNAPELIKVTSDKVNSLLMDPFTFLYGKLSNIILNKTSLSSFVYNYESNVRYFTYQINKNLIKEVNKETFNNIQTDPLFTSVKLNYISGFDEQELKIAEQKIPGITDFVNTSYTPPPIEEDGTVG